MIKLDNKSIINFKSPNNKPIVRVRYNSQNVYPSNGLYVLMNDKTTYSIDNYNMSNNQNAIGLLLITNLVKFAFAKNCNAQGGLMWSSILSNTDVSGIVNSEYDYNGYANSEIIRSLTNQENNSVNYAYSNPLIINEETIPGYIGSTGEYMEMYKRQTEIDNALKLIGGTTLIEKNNGSNNLYLITSTEDPTNPSTTVCYISWYDVGIYKYGKTRTDGNYYTLPLYKI